MKLPSLQGYVNLAEIGKSVLAGLGVGSLTGLALVVVQALQTNASVEFANPLLASLATMALSMLADQLRRLDHGTIPPKP